MYKKCGSVKLKNLSEEELEVLLIRTNLTFKENDESNILFYYYKKFLERYSSEQLKCCDPFNCDKQIVKTRLVMLTLLEHETFKSARRFANVVLIKFVAMKLVKQKVCQVMLNFENADQYVSSFNET